MMVCRSCGHRNANTTTWCEQCNAYLEFEGEHQTTQTIPPVPSAPPASSDTARLDPLPPVPPPPSMRVTPPASLAPPLRPGEVLCPDCGWGNEPVRRFCRHCGAAFGAPPGLTAAEPSLPAGQRRRPPADRLRVPLILGAVVVLALAGGAAAWLLWPAKAASHPKTNVSTATTTSVVDLDVLKASASSTLPSDGGLTYTVQNTLDGNPDTAWNSDGRKVGRGVGVTLTYTFAKPVDLRRITIVNGYTKGIRYQQNGRIKRLHVSTDAGQQEWDLSDVRGEKQALAVRPGVTTQVVFRVDEVYPGQKFKDLALTEITFSGFPRT